MELSQEKLMELLSGKERLFAEVYEAVAEQYLLLALKARHLYKDNQYSKWFTEQHEVLKKLLPQSDKIVKAYRDFFFKNPSRHPLDVAMHVMSSFYQGFDNNNQIMQTWGGMIQDPTKGGRNFGFRDLPQNYNEAHQIYVKEDLFKLLISCKVSATPIPLDERMGYSHQDLAISFSCSDTITSGLNEFFNIDYLDILDKTVECFSNDNDEFNNLTSLLLKRRRMHADLKNAVTTRSQIIAAVDLLFSKISYVGVQHFLSMYVGFAAQATHGWLMNTQQHFKFKHPVNYKWEYKVVDLRKEGTDYLSSLTQDDIYGQILISRASIIQLIRRNGAAGFDDVALEISRELGALYSELLTQPSSIDESSFDEKEEHIASGDNDNDKSDTISPDRAVAYLEHMAKWQRENKVLLVKDSNAKRQDKVNVVGWLYGLKAYDMKIGIPNGDKFNLKDEIYDMIRKDDGLCNMKASSNSTLQRYHSKIKKNINKNGITALINEQKELNKNTPFNSAIYTTRPLWEQ